MNKAKKLIDLLPNLTPYQKWVSAEDNRRTIEMISNGTVKYTDVVPDYEYEEDDSARCDVQEDYLDIYLLLDDVYYQEKLDFNTILYYAQSKPDIIVTSGISNISYTNINDKSTFSVEEVNGYWYVNKEWGK